MSHTSFFFPLNHFYLIWHLLHSGDSGERRSFFLVSSSSSGQDTPHENGQAFRRAAESRLGCRKTFRPACHFRQSDCMRLQLRSLQVFWTSPLQPCCKNPLNTSQEVQAGAFEQRSVPMAYRRTWWNLKKDQIFLLRRRTAPFLSCIMVVCKRIHNLNLLTFCHICVSLVHVRKQHKLLKWNNIIHNSSLKKKLKIWKVRHAFLLAQPTCVLQISGGTRLKF